MKSKNVIFIEKAKKVHKDKYDYSLVNYKNNRTKVKILCSKHGVFEKTPKNHITKKQGCPKCSFLEKSKLKKYSNETFIEKAEEIHGKKYDYSLTKYISSKKHIKIICPIHGIFNQIAYSHLKGYNCPKCKENYNFTNEIFIKKSKEIHNNKWDYSLTKYINNKTSVKIICSKHGIFKQRPLNHLNLKQGCPKCSLEIKSSKRRNNNNFFIKKANKIHNNKYDYSLSNYIKDDIKIDIICLKHGIFKQTPKNHLNLKQGCPRCKTSKGETQIENYLKRKNIKYETQKTFEDCYIKNNYLLKFDFYLPHFNSLIEYDGIQHFKIIEYFGGRSGYMKRKWRDKKKDEFCKEKGILLIRIPYWEKKNINTILYNYLK